MTSHTKPSNQADQSDPGLEPPKKGDRFRCEQCGMALEITVECKCHDDHVHFHCCGKEMAKV
jgi:hypothetical protein